MAESDRFDVRSRPREVGEVHRHRVGVVEQPCVGTHAAHVRGDRVERRKRAQRSEDPADTEGVGDRLPDAVPCRYLEVDPSRCQAAHLNHVDHEVGTVERLGPIKVRRRRSASRSAAPGSGCAIPCSRREALGVDVVEPDRQRTQIVVPEEVRK